MRYEGERFHFSKIIILLRRNSVAQLDYSRSRFYESSRTELPDPAKPSPQLILWAWERPTDLRFIDAKRVGVAFLAKSILLEI